MLSGSLIQKINERIAQLHIPNGMVGSEYLCVSDFNIAGLRIASATLRSADNSISDIGLTVEHTDSELRLTGKPKEKCEIKINFSVHNTVPVKSFYINPDPKSLWKTRDVDWDKEGCYENKDEYARGEPVACAEESTLFHKKQIEVIAASVRGRSHAHKGKPRDDACHFDFDKDTGWYFVSVADGVSTAKYSREGARLATKTVVEKLPPHQNLWVNSGSGSLPRA